MRYYLSGRTLALAAGTAIVALLSLLFQLPVAAAPGVALQEGEPGLQQVTEAIEAAADWLAANHQNADGGYSSFSGGADLAPSDVGGTLDALWALGTAEADVGPPTTYLETNADALAAYVAQDGSTAGKAVLALSAGGLSLEEVISLDSAVAISQHLSPTGQFGVNTAFNQSLAVLALAVIGQPPPQEAIDWLADQQETEGELAGSWDDGFGTAGNPDSTAMALVALLAGRQDVEDPAIQAGLSFLEQAQLASGGWEYGPGFGENANSTALVILALSLLGQDLTSAESRWVKDGVDPVTALLSWQGESWAFQADYGDGRFDDFFSTVQSLVALGVHAARMGSGPIEAPVVEAPLEMTPTFTPAANEATTTPEPPTVTPEPAEVPATASPEPEAAEAVADQPDMQGGEGEASATSEAAEESGGGASIWPWVIAIVIAAFVLLGWRLLDRRQEA